MMTAGWAIEIAALPIDFSTEGWCLCCVFRQGQLRFRCLVIMVPIALWSGSAAAAERASGSALWELAKAKQAIHRFSTLFTAQQVRDHLSTDKGIDAAIQWCRKTAVTKVYIEVFRDGYQAKREALRHAKERFQAAGVEVSGCVTTTNRTPSNPSES